MIHLQTSSLPSEALLKTDRLLSLVDFDSTTAGRPHDPRHIVCPLTPLVQNREMWLSSSAVTCGQQGNIHYAATDEVLIGSLVVEDTGSDLARLTHEVYAELLAWLPQQQHQHLWRMWNVFPAINEGDGDNERYRAFCEGRHLAYMQNEMAMEYFPAATAIGGTAPQLFIMFMAGIHPSQHLENPRQISAYRYPRQYGRRSPSFARATRIASSTVDSESMLISGTASIIGHESHHINDWQAQLDETNKNLEVLIGQSDQALTARALRVYVRHGTAAQPIVDQLRARWGGGCTITALQADICRRELLLEVEGVWQTAPVT